MYVCIYIYMCFLEFTCHLRFTYVCKGFIDLYLGDYTFTSRVFDVPEEIKPVARELDTNRGLVHPVEITWVNEPTKQHEPL